MNKILTVNKTNIISSLIFFLIFCFATVFYLYVINKSESYLLKYRFEYDKKLIDTSYFTMNILPKFNDAEFERGDEFFLECETKSECEIKQKNMKNLSISINNTLWKTTKKFIDKEFEVKNNSLNKPNSANETIEAINEYNFKDDQIFFFMYDEKEAIDINSYRYLLNVEYLLNENNPNLFIIATNLIDNTFNKKFSQFFAITVLNFFMSLLFFLVLSNMKSKK